MAHALRRRRSCWPSRDGANDSASRNVLRDAGALAIATFPHTLVPNKLVKELRALALAAGTPLPFVEELAADIFMGAFSETYLKAAQLAVGAAARHAVRALLRAAVRSDSGAARFAL